MTTALNTETGNRLLDTKEGVHSFEDLQYEFFQDKTEIPQAVKEYLIRCKKDADASRQRIVYNCIEHLFRFGILPEKVFASTNAPWSLLFAFRNEDLYDNRLIIYNILGKVHQLAWKHESRDYGWHCARLNGLIEDELSNDYRLILELRREKTK